MPAGNVVAEYETAYLRTRIIDQGDGGFVWLRSPGVARTAPSELPGQAVYAMAHQVNAFVGGLVLPELDGDALRFVLPLPASSARLTLTADPGNQTLVAEGMRALGRTLQCLHTMEPAEGIASAPPGLRRLATWLDSGQGPDTAPKLHELLRKRLGADRMARVREWCAEGEEPGTTPGLVHGGASLGRHVPAVDGQVGGGLLVEEGLALGAGSFDLGWLLGELAELETAAARGLGAAPAIDYRRPARALLEGYGPVPDPALVGRFAVLRVCTHIHDFAAYVGWHEDLRAYADLVTELVDEEGVRALELLHSR